MTGVENLTKAANSAPTFLVCPNHQSFLDPFVLTSNFPYAIFRRIFHDSVVRFQDVLGSVFDAWEARFGVKVDRELVCELLIRYVLSEQLVPGDADRKTLPRRIGRMVEALATGAPPRARR